MTSKAVGALLSKFSQVIRRDFPPTAPFALWEGWASRLAEKDPSRLRGFLELRESNKELAELMNKYQIGATRDDAQKMQRVARSVGLELTQKRPPPE
uniref:Uncharacterized protein n=1 Tax=Chromera velia CCMP2878 TaxID=1169474 RepID=A0A0G4I0W9_9ALVE|mmetsp:Transcript_52967/g.103605  ORF Transcript_52967/g.103605 Transcript_52967/m.103605 type:complete len:97 (+) Transcript_52967:319-609(+)|eukprot:Cvel_34522.t1-p1 / transcript=Cvel_34522.t1 / gene=Cvel_34522 / organism=Chromera_velia_CCMP2878 / gene_product=hypothetical protein / transcript_product=hypothetical protein / location=Cvel_scaffold5961:1087-1374(+) / protein_length=96 / sequence_SO=supercontig / SO=protein_coding / is_pseudo=false